MQNTNPKPTRSKFTLLQQLHPGFGGRRRPKFAFRFKRLIHVVDSTTLALVARCMDWAKHRRRKAAAKCHVRLNLQTFLPRFALVDTAGEHDNLRAHELCAGVQAGEIVIFDKAYLDFDHLADFLRHNANAGRWQVWTALLVYLLLRCCAFLSQWGHSFTRLFTLLRAVLWQRWDWPDLLEGCGTGTGHNADKITKALNSFRSQADDSFGNAPGLLKLRASVGCQ